MKTFAILATLLSGLALGAKKQKCEPLFLEAIINSIKAGNVIQVAQPKPNIYVIYEPINNEALVFQSKAHEMPDKSRFAVTMFDSCRTGNIDYSVFLVKERPKS